MAHHKSAEKRIRQAVVATARNRTNNSRMKSAVKKAEVAIASGNKAEAEAALKAAMPELARGVVTGVVHKNTAARKMSRLTKRLRTLA
jgi:small subunit ribosomal protein S20|nr:30S ribosomal protein S20 [uncultured Dongia sp.]